VINELIHLNLAIPISITRREDQVNNLSSVLIIQAFLPQEHIHLVLINPVASILVNCSEFSLETSSFLSIDTVAKSTIVAGKALARSALSLLDTSLIKSNHTTTLLLLSYDY
jgi:hypothetical protein